MEHVVPTFPLLHLPYSEQQRVLRNMDCHSQLAFSTLSKKATSLVKTLRTTLRSLTLSIENPIQLELACCGMPSLTLRFDYGEERGGQLNSVGMCPENCHLESSSYMPLDRPEDHTWIFSERNDMDYQREVDRWPRRYHLGYTITSQWYPNRTLRDWLLHILNIFHGSHIDRLDISDEVVEFDLASIKAALQAVEVHMLWIDQIDDEELFKKITQMFLPVKRLEIEQQVENADYLLTILFSNFEFFNATASQNPYFGSLDRLLTINAASIFIESCPMTDKTIKKFLKLWIRGAMPRLKRLGIDFDLVLKKDVTLDGINFHEMRNDEQRSGMFEGENGPQWTTVKGGRSITRFDGTHATLLLLGSGDNVSSLDFFIWDD